MVEGLVGACVRSAKYLANQMDKEEIATQELAPLLEITMRLSNQTVQFEPPMGRAANGRGIRNIVGDWLGTMVNISTLVLRVDTPDEDGDYLLDLFEDPTVRAVTAQINRHLEINERECEEFRAEFMQYSYLWCSDINEVPSTAVLHLGPAIVNYADRGAVRVLGGKAAAKCADRGVVRVLMEEWFWCSKGV